MAGRPNKYVTNVEPRFEEIKKWARNGATDKEIARQLDVNERVFCKYKKQYNQLSELLKNARQGAVEDIKAAMYKRAIGFNYTESKFTEDDEGHWKKETYTKAALPDPTSALILLKHWDKDTEWSADPASLKLKKEEFELKKKQAESEVW